MSQPHKPTIFVRGTENWKGFTSQTYLDYAPHALSHLLGDTSDHDRVLTNLRWWNENMRTPFPTYRAEVAEVAEESWSATGMSTQFERHAGATHWVVPTDDDDLYHPGLSHYISDAIDDHEPRIVYWDCWCYVPCTAHCFYSGSAFFKSPLLGSNAYAVNATEDAVVIYNHCDATRLLLSGVKAAYIDKALSIWVRHPASLYSMRDSDLSKSMVKMCEAACPKEIEWAGGYLDRLERSTKALLGMC
jgi:hypothetical protein